MCQHRRKTFVVELHGNFRLLLAPAVYKLLHAGQVLAGLTVGLTRLAHHDELHLFLNYIAAQIVEQFRSSNSRQPAGNQLQRVGDC